MATSTSGPQGPRNVHAKVYSLGGNRRDEPAKQNPWHKYCKEYATKNNISYAAAISLASPSWRAHKEKNGLSFRDRTRRAEREPSEHMDDEESQHPHTQQQRERPRKPKETFRKDDYKRERSSSPTSERAYEGGYAGAQLDRQESVHQQVPKKKRVKKEKAAPPPNDDDYARYQEFLRYRSMNS
jgi:hypothetical protein